MGLPHIFPTVLRKSHSWPRRRVHGSVGSSS